MKIVVTVTRTFEMNERRVLAEPGFKPPEPAATVEAKQRWLTESFFELCGFSRDVDHVDGSYVHLVDEDGETEFEWPEGLR